MIYLLLAGVASAAITQKIGFYSDSGCNSALSSDDAMCAGMSCAAYGTGLPSGTTCSKSGCSVEITYSESFSKSECEAVQSGLDPCTDMSMFHVGYEIDCSSGASGNSGGGGNSGQGGNSGGGGGNDDSNNAAALSLIAAFLAPVFTMMW